ncbi:MAG: M23 family metallopeptidase [Treponema sp.]|nr:M23 family metallopeptidase [Treponema sp.]
MKTKNQIILFFLFLTCASAFAQTAVNIQKENLPDIQNLKSKDPVFKEYSLIVQDNYKAIRANRELEFLFFVHTVSEADSALLSGRDSQLMGIASRCNISYETLATLNSIENSTDELMGKTLIIPTVPGLFIKTDQKELANSLEIVLYQNYSAQEIESPYYFEIDGIVYVFLADQRLSPVERAYFLDSALALPLDRDSFWISSEFGKRKNPIDGKWKDHNGIDFAAPEGTPVYAIKDGYVAYCISEDKTLGNYVILTHDTGKMTSVYAHLSSFCINQYDFVRKGAIIGYVGHTGMATGSHLHFEIRQGGVAQDPRSKLNIK